MLRVIFDPSVSHRGGAEDGMTGMSHCINGVRLYHGIQGKNRIRHGVSLRLKATTLLE